MVMQRKSRVEIYLEVSLWDDNGLDIAHDGEGMNKEDS